MNRPVPAAKWNRLLDSLSRPTYARLARSLVPVSLSLGDVLCEPSGEMCDVYLPLTCVVSLLVFLKDGASAELALVGREGVVGVAAFLGGRSTTSSAIVQCAGTALRLGQRVLQREFARCGEVRRLLLLYAQVLMTQIGQTAVCNRHHTVDQQLCRWLLLSVDRVSSSRLEMTQELIANMLGVRREGVTQAAGRLQAAHLIDYARGRIDVLDRSGLEQRACECYRAVRGECDRLLPSGG